MNSETSAQNILRDLELEVEAEGREWMRRRLEEKLQAQVEEKGAIFPPRGAKGAPLVNDNYSCSQCQLKPSVTPAYFFMFYCSINCPLPSAHPFGGA